MPDPAAALRLAALRLLTRREHSRAELKSKLAGQADSVEDLDAILDRLESERLLSDQRFASQRVQARAGRYGNARLRQELRQDGVSSDEIEAVLADGGDEVERCRAVWLRKFGEVAKSPEERAKQLRFLQYRGFSSDAIRRALRGVDPE